MESIHYHPLVCNDDEGIEQVPLFFTEDRQAISDRHDLFLKGIVPHYYRLCAKYPHKTVDEAKYRIHCHLCGRTMKAISRHIDEHKLSLYCCENYSEKENEQ